MTRRIKTALAWSAVAIIVGGDGAASAQALLVSAPSKMPASLASSTPELVTMVKGEQSSIDFPADMRTAIFPDPKVVNVEMPSARHAVIQGMGLGQTNIQFVDAAGRTVNLKVRVDPDTSDLERVIGRLVPAAHVTIDPLGDKLVLNGTVNSNAEMDRTVQLAAAAAGGADKVVNLLNSTGNDQVSLKIEVVEINRDSIKQLGFNTNALFGQLGTNQWGLGNKPTFAVNSGFQGGFSGGMMLNTTSQPVGTSPISLFGNLVGIPFGTTGITNATIGQTIDTFMRGTGALTGAQSTWAKSYLAQYAGQVQVVDNATNTTYTMADVGINMNNLPAQIQAYYANSSALDSHGNEWIRKFLDGLPDYNTAYYSYTANPNSTFIDRSNPANPVATNRVGSPGLNQGQGLMQAFERVGLSRTLANPNGTAISGKEFKTQVGGTIFVPTGVDNQGRVQLTEKEYGILLKFTPVVLSDGDIQLEINTEVSDISTKGAQTVTTPTGTQTIPSLSKSTASTTVRMSAGSSIELAGLLSDKSSEDLDKVPGLADALGPLGALFRSRDYLAGQTELVVIATVDMVHPVGRDQLHTPADGLQVSPDMSTILVGRLNRTYSARPDATEGRSYEGPFGHVID